MYDFLYFTHFCILGSRESNLDALKIILEFAEIYTQSVIKQFFDSDEKTPLELAIESGNTQVVEVLLDFISNHPTEADVIRTLHICARYVDKQMFNL